MMTRPWRATAILASAILTAGCGSTAIRDTAAPAAVTVTPLSLSTALTGQGVTWATVPMGAASGPNLFWQLLVRTAGSTQWTLVTPPDVPTNGALILAGPGGRDLTVGVLPALSLRFSPVTSSQDAGQTWAAGPPLTGLAGAPDALATSPGGQLIALTQNGQVSQARSASAAWTPLASRPSLAAVPAAASCAPASLTVVAYSPAGEPLTAAACSRPGAAGIFAYTGGTWRSAAPALPAALSRQHLRVLRLTRTGSRDTALLQAGTGAQAALIAAWTADSGATWTLSPLLGLGGAHIISASFGDNGSAALVLSGNRGETITGPGAQWQALPSLPSGRTVTLALPAAGGTDALAANGSILTVWHLAPGSAAWTRTQVTKVPIQYGSSA